jgi:hypothetical protein
VIRWVVGVVLGLGVVLVVRHQFGVWPATIMFGPSLWLTIGVGGWLADRQADRKREERWGRVIDVTGRPIRSIDR